MSTEMNASLFTGEEGKSTDTADSSEQEYRSSLGLLRNIMSYSIAAHSHTVHGVPDKTWVF